MTLNRSHPLIRERGSTPISMECVCIRMMLRIWLQTGRWKWFRNQYQTRRRQRDWVSKNNNDNIVALSQGNFSSSLHSSWEHSLTNKSTLPLCYSSSTVASSLYHVINWKLIKFTRTATREKSLSVASSFAQRNRKRNAIHKPWLLLYATHKTKTKYPHHPRRRSLVNRLNHRFCR